jgi:hypothetical protein
VVRITRRAIPVTRRTTTAGCSRGSTAGARRRRSSSRSSPSGAPTCSSPSTRFRPSSASPRRTFIVFAANAFALLGLRALYFLVTGLLDRLVYLSSGLSLILLFIGVKLLLHFGHLQNDAIPEIATSTSLLVILGILAVTVGASLTKARRDPGARGPRGLASRPARGEPPAADHGRRGRRRMTASRSMRGEADGPSV